MKADLESRASFGDSEKVSLTSLMLSFVKDSVGQTH